MAFLQRSTNALVNGGRVNTEYVSGQMGKGANPLGYTFLCSSTDGGEQTGEGRCPPEGTPAVTAGRQVRAQVASLIGHIFRVPLTFILAYSAIALESSDTQQANGVDCRMIRSIHRHAARLREVVDELTPLLEWSLSRLPDQPSSFDLRLVVGEVAFSMGGWAAERGQIIDCTLSSQPVDVVVDEWGAGALLTLVLCYLSKQLSGGERLRIQVDRQDELGMVVIEADGGPLRMEDHEGIDMDALRSLAAAIGGRLDVATGDEVRLLIAFPLAHRVSSSDEER